MPLIVKTTGLDQYAPGGSARVKILTIGGPGAGKTRWSSYFPLPIFADCEGGLASVADREVPYAEIKSSQDMLDLLAFLKQECRQPQEQRKYQTVVIDTLDAFQRKIKNEWMEINRKEQFAGWEAWGFLNAKMQLLMTRLLNLDLNVIVNVHYKDKTTKDDETGRETHTFMLQLQGETADTAYNDFDLVGWMGTYWEPVNGERVQKRGLTFKATPDKPFLKDRLHVTPPWLEVAFADSDYTNLFERVQAKAALMKSTRTLGEIPSEAEPVPPAVLAPGAVGTGALPAQAPREIPLAQLDKPTLMKRARDLGVTVTVDGSPIRTNTLKTEVLAAVEAALNATKSAAPSEAAPATGNEAPSADSESAKAPVANPDRTVVTDQGTVNTETGEVLDAPPLTPVEENSSVDDATLNKAIDVIEQGLGGSVLPSPHAPVQKAPGDPVAQPAKSTPAASSEVRVCEECGTNLADEKQDFVKLAFIKYRKRLCEADYLKRKSQPVGAR